MIQESRVVTDECMILSHTSYLALPHCHTATHCDVFLDGLSFDLCTIDHCRQLNHCYQLSVISYLTYDVLSLLILPPASHR
jgi:hypothetical protein